MNPHDRSHRNLNPARLPFRHTRPGLTLGARLYPKPIKSPSKTAAADASSTDWGAVAVHQLKIRRRASGIVDAVKIARQREWRANDRAGHRQEVTAFETQRCAAILRKRHVGKSAAGTGRAIHRHGETASFRVATLVPGLVNDRSRSAGKKTAARQASHLHQRYAGAVVGRHRNGPVHHRAAICY